MFRCTACMCTAQTSLGRCLLTNLTACFVPVHEPGRCMHNKHCHTLYKIMQHGMRG